MSSKSRLLSWSGRTDIEDGDLALRAHQVVQTFEAESGISLIGLASDLGVEYNQGRIGAKDGPAHFREAFANLAWHFNTQLFDLGDYTVTSSADGDPLAHAQAGYAATAAKALNAKQFVIGVGGGHEIGWASYSACRQYLDSIGATDKTVSIINFDAHFDVRRPLENTNWAGTSGTPFYQASIDCHARKLNFNYACLGINESANTKALFNYAEANEVRYLLDRDCNTENANTIINDFVEQADYLYVTLCLDALPANVAPGVSAPAALGISLDFIIQSLTQIKHACTNNSTAWLMSDIAELNPKYDIDQRTAKVAARLAYEIIRLQQ